MKKYYIEVETNNMPTMETLQVLLGPYIKVQEVIELEPCNFCKGVGTHEQECPNGLYFWMYGGDR